MRDMETTQNQTTAPTLKFSVAMCVYKGDDAEHFDLALKSVTDDQTVKPDEIVLVVDGPVSETIENVIVKYSSKYNIFKIIRLPENKGLGNGLRLAIENCSNEWIARMDGDDISVPTRFEQQIEFLKENPEVDIVGGNISEFIDNPFNIISFRTVPISDYEIKSYMKKRCAMNHVSVMYKKTAILKVGNYQDWSWNEDYYLWIRMYQNHCTFANIGTTLVNVRVGEDMYRRRGGWKYFQSEAKLQNYMRKNKIIGFGTYFVNVTKRFIVQILLPNKLRGWVFKKFARKSNV